MKRSKRTRLSKDVAAGDRSGIEARWVWGIEVLRDPESMSETGKSLRPGVTERLIADGATVGDKLSEREIRRRLQCARTYPCDSQIGQALADYTTWFDLAEAGFPPYPALPGEDPADVRTPAERRRDQNKAMLEHDHQGGLFPDFEPPVTRLRIMKAYTAKMNGLAANYTAHCAARTAYMDQLIAAAGGDLDMTWAEAEDRLAARCVV